MSARIETMTHFGEVPWHGLSTPMTESEAYDLDACRKKAGLNWEAEKVQLCTVDTHTPVDAYAVRRVKDGRILGDSVGERYTILQNREAFRVFQPFVEAKEVQLHTAGALCGGSIVWILAKLNLPPIEVTAGDIVEKFLLLSHSHDGSLAIRIGFTPIRVVCANTLAMAHNSDASKLIRVKHSKRAITNLENIRETMNLANQEFEATAAQYRLLSSKNINSKDIEKYVRLVFADMLKKDKDDQEIDDIISVPSDRFKTRARNILDRVKELFETGKGNTLPSVRGTYWAAYNGVTEYLAWEKGGKTTKKKNDARLSSLWYGMDAVLNKHALNTAVELALAV